MPESNTLVTRYVDGLSAASNTRKNVNCCYACPAYVKHSPWSQEITFQSSTLPLIHPETIG
jgi:hypothetical protein